MTFLSFTIAGLPLTVTLIFIPLLPDLIPAHYNMAGEITRWGSKFENLIFPVTIIAIALGYYSLFRLSIKYFNKNKLKINKAQPEKYISQIEIILAATLFIIILALGALSVWLLIKGYNISIKEYGRPEINNFQLGCLCVGLFLLIAGILFPFTPRNPVFSLRTTTTMSSDEAWRKIHFRSGITLAFFNLAAVLFNVFFSNGMINAYVSIPLIVLSFILIFAEHVIISKKL